MTDFVGNKYKQVSSENFEEYLKTLGVNTVIRKIANNVTIHIQLLEKDGTFTLKVQSTFKNKDIVFKPGEEFEDISEDGRKVTSVILMEKDKMVHTSKVKEDGLETTVVRTFSDAEVVAVLTCKDVTATNKFKRVL